MPLFRRIDPDLRSLIAYIVARTRDRGITLTRTRLVKLLYLIDIDRVRGRREPLTRLHWVFFHYGPYAYELIDTLDAMEGDTLVAQRWNDSVLYRAAPDAPDAEDWNAGTKSVIDRVIDLFAPLEQNELLDHVYFHTGPMLHARRGQPLDLLLARDDPPDRRRPPLQAPTPPTDVDERLANWRARNARRLAPAVLIPPGRFLDASEDDQPYEGVRGVLHVPDDCEL